MADRRRRRNSASESDNDANAATATDEGAPSEDVLPADDKREAPTADAAAADGAAADGDAESDEEEEAYDEEFSGSQGDGEEVSEEGDEGEDHEGEEDTEDDECSEGEEETDGEEESAEGEHVKEGDSVKQRESGDGQEQTEASVLDDDEDTKNPAYIPRKGLFYEHDLRLEDDGEAAARKNGAPERPKKKLWSDGDKWLHDRYDDSQQRPKSREELISIYGFDIRERDAPPDDSVAMLRGRGRGSRGYGSRGGRRPYRLGDYVQPSQRQRVYSREDRSQRDENEELEEGEERQGKGERTKRIAEVATGESKNVAARSSSSSSGGEQEQQPPRWTTPPPQPTWQRGQRGSRGGYRGAPGARGGRGEGARRGGSSAGPATADSTWSHRGRGRRTEWGPSRPPANRGQATEPVGPTAATPAVVSAGESRTFRTEAVPSESRQGAGVTAEMPEKTLSAGGNAPVTAGPTLSAAAGDGSRASGDASSDSVVAPAKVISTRRGDSSATMPARADVQNRRADQGGSGGPSARHPSNRQQQRDVRQDSGSAQGVRATAASEGDAKGSSQQQQAKPKRYSTQRQRASSPPSSQRQPATAPANMDATMAGAAPAAKNLEFYSSQHSQAASVHQQQQVHPAAGYVQHSGGITSLPMATTQQVLPPAAMMHGANPMAYGGSLPMGSLHAGTPRLVFTHMAPPAADQVLGGPRLSAQAAAAAQYLPAAPGAAPGIMQPGAAMMYNIPTHPGSHPTPAGLPSGTATYVMQPPPPPGSLPVSYGSPGSRTQIMPAPQPGQEGFSLGGTTYYGAAAMMQPPDVISAGPQYYGDGTAAVTSHSNVYYYAPPVQPASRTPTRRPKAAIPIMRPEEAVGMPQAGGEGLPSGTDGTERLAMHSNAGPSVVEYNHAAAGEPRYFTGVSVVYEAGTAAQFGATKAQGSYNGSLAGRPPDAMAATSSATLDSRMAAVDSQMVAISLGSTEVVAGTPSS